MNFVVKNTTKWGLLDLLCPHSCRGCGVLGAVLCDRCKNYIIQNQKAICPFCRRTFGEQLAQQDRPSGSANLDLRVCRDCDSVFKGFWAVGWREGVLAKLVSELKYQSVRACADTLAELLDQSIPQSTLKDYEVILVPLPTIGKHIRARGLDHTKLLAKKLASRRGWQMRELLKRANDTVQVGTNAAKRVTQAGKAYELFSTIINSDSCYVLLDDVWTTGASMQAAANILKQAGAKHIYGVVVEIGRSKAANNEDDTAL